MNKDHPIKPHPGHPQPATVSADETGADAVTTANKNADEAFNAGTPPATDGEATDEVTKVNEAAADQFRNGGSGNLTGNRVGGFRGSSD